VLVFLGKVEFLKSYRDFKKGNAFLILIFLLFSNPVFGKINKLRLLCSYNKSMSAEGVFRKIGGEEYVYIEYDDKGKAEIKINAVIGGELRGTVNEEHVSGYSATLLEDHTLE